jgi:hypothetical protein
MLAVEPHLLKDINPGTYGSHLAGFAEVGGVLYFSTIDQVNGEELWKSDGTPTGEVDPENWARG